MTFFKKNFWVLKITTGQHTLKVGGFDCIPCTFFSVFKYKNCLQTFFSLKFLMILTGAGRHQVHHQLPFLTMLTHPCWGHTTLSTRKSSHLLASWAMANAE